MLESILSTLGSVASIAGVILVFRQSNTNRIIKGILIVILLLSVSTGIVSYRNYVFSSLESAKERERQEKLIRTKAAVKEAKELLSTIPSFIDRYNPGANEGTVYNGIAFLEKYKDLFPESYELIKANAINDIKTAKATRGSDEQLEVMEIAANAIRQVIEGIAGPSGRP